MLLLYKLAVFSGTQNCGSGVDNKIGSTLKLRSSAPVRVSMRLESTYKKTDGGDKIYRLATKSCLRNTGHTLLPRNSNSKRLKPVSQTTGHEISPRNSNRKSHRSHQVFVDDLEAKRELLAGELRVRLCHLVSIGGGGGSEKKQSRVKRAETNKKR